MTIHPREDVDRLYVSRKEGESRLASYEDSVVATIRRLDDSIEKYEQRPITATRNDTYNTKFNRMTITRKQEWEEKQLYRRFKRLMTNISREKTRTWIRKGNLKRETESVLMPAQNNTIRTNDIKARIDKTQQNSNCRFCRDRDETVNHIISKSSKLAQKEYKTRHDRVGKGIHWGMGKKLKFVHTNK